MKAEFTMNYIKPNKNVLHAKGDLTIQWTPLFKETLIQLLKTGMGKSKDLAIVISLQEATAIDVSALQLLHVFKKAMEATDHSVSIISPELPSLADLIIKSGWGPILYTTVDAKHTK